MFQTISWFKFIRFLIAIVAIYYFSVVAYYFKKKLFNYSLTRRTPALRGIHIKKEEQPAGVTSDKDAGNDQFTSVRELLDHLKVLFKSAWESRLVKEELLQALRSTLKAYPGISKTDLVEDIDTHIKQEAKDICGMDILPEELKQIWN
jgi:hypothetical protein